MKVFKVFEKRNAVSFIHKRNGKMDRDRNSGKILLVRLCRVFLTFVLICFAKFSLKMES